MFAIQFVSEWIMSRFWVDYLKIQYYWKYWLVEYENVHYNLSWDEKIFKDDLSNFQNNRSAVK